MNDVYTEQEMYRTYLVIDVDNKVNTEDYRLKIIQNNQLMSFLPFQLRSQDGNVKYYYDMLSEESLLQQLEKGLNEKQLINFAISLLHALDEMGEYLLDENDIYLDPSAIFYMPEGNYVFTYYPGYGQSVAMQMSSLAALFLRYVDYTQDNAVKSVYEFYHMTSNERSFLKNLRLYVLKATAPDIEAQLKNTNTDFQSNIEPEISDEKTFGYSGEVNYSKARILSDYEKPQHFVPAAYHEIEHKDNKFMQKVSVGVIAGVLCFIETGAALLCLKLFNQIPMQWIIAVGAAAVIVTMLTALGIVLFMNKQKEQDFWQTDDCEDPYIQIRGDTNSERNTELLSSPETMAIQRQAQTAVLKSVNAHICPNIQLTSFPSLIGKAVSDSHCRINAPTVSRRHARIEYTGREFCLTDLKSSNGTFVNGEMLCPMKPVAVHSGDSIIFADVEFIFDLLEVKA